MAIRSNQQAVVDRLRERARSLEVTANSVDGAFGVDEHAVRDMRVTIATLREVADAFDEREIG